MGVHGLWKLLESTGKPINPETLEGKILAVDISIWLNQALKGVRDRDGNSVQNAHLLTLFHRLCKLLFFRIKPIFVFDGKAPLLKKQTLAVRRQKKEEKTLESKQTNEKLLKTFLKRQAIKAALGDRSQESLPSLSSVRREEVDDLYVLPALPSLQEREKSSSEEEEELEEQLHHSYQGDVYEDPNSVDINSEEFAAMPPEVKHEILKDMKEFSKRRRTMYHTPPERSGDFSQYQLAGLLQRNKLNVRLEGVEREMSNRSAGNAPGAELYSQKEGHSVETRRLLSEDSTHYILIKGPKKPDKSERVPDNQAAASPWSGGPLSERGRTGGAGRRPEPLWRPISEEESQEEEAPRSPTQPQTSQTSPKDAAPPSPRTLKAIQAAMEDSFSDEDGVPRGRGDSGGGQGGRGVSPRTLLAIQTAMTEEAMPPSALQIRSSPGTPHPTSPQPSQLAFINRSEEEPGGMDAPLRSLLANEDIHQVKMEEVQQPCRPPSFPGPPADILILSEEEVDHGGRSTVELEEVPRRSRVELEEVQRRSREELEEVQRRSKEELEEAINLRNRAFHSAVGQTEGLGQGQEVHTSALGLDGEEDMARSLLSVPELDVIIPSSLEERNSEMVKMEDSEESDSESFIDVPEEELKEEETCDSLMEVRGGAPPDEVHEKVAKDEEEKKGLEEAVSSGAVQLEEEDVETDEEESQPSSQSSLALAPPPAPNEWEDINMEELLVLERHLEEQQSSLREQKQQQERVAANVTGQMCLESQELLRLFGVPFLVAPSEAEAQCAALDRTDQTHGTITDDSDVWLFGGRHVYKNFFSQNKYIEHYQYIDLQNQLGVDRTKLINLAYLLGSDYTEGVQGVGYVTGMEILNEFPGPGMEPLRQFSEWWSLAQENKRLTSDPRDSKVKKKLRGLRLQAGFPNPAVATAYLEPAVDLSEGSFSWGRPHVDLIKDFCESRFGWNSRKTEETLQPVIKQLNTQQSQLRIDSFFRVEQQERQAIRSQRLRRVVTCLKRKEREDGGGEGQEEDHEEQEEGISSPSKAKKGRSAEQRKEVAAVGAGFFFSSRGH
ncbi:DNA repair protein complementing XP-G cells homolog [Esox lucius]|uniref:DNA repair protein complementing XP-G cells homolog n=1 Tax=Esox lucius TaxID=8010 RepID=UPI00147720D9|nr:DNA repair protein complementing XP-G cells homolog [Esox lucius]XP_028972485.2 DNA repair protein complementing XP-G cells homolog [Esox lucius]